MHTQTSSTPPYSNTAVGPPPWGIQTVLLAFAIAFVLIPGLVASALPWLHIPSESSIRLWVLHITTYAAWLGCLLIGLKTYGTPLWRWLGVCSRQAWWDVLLMGLVCSGCIFTISWASSALANFYHWPIEKPFDRFSADQMQVIALLAVGVAPVFEELIFRGFLQPCLYRYMRAEWAIFLTALFFTLFHYLYLGHWLAMGYVFCLGLLLGLFRAGTQSTLPGMIGHLLNNLIAVLILLPV